MDYRSRLFLSHARASPVGDADRHRPIGPTSQLGLPAQTPERRWLKKCHGGRGYGTRNADGERILDYAEAHDLRLINTFFAKPAAHLRTYYSGGKDSQIDFVLTRRRDFRLALDAKIIPSESIGPQHRPLVVTMRIELPREKRDDRNNAAQVKWWKLKERTADVIANIDLPPIDAADTAWTAFANSMQ
uniref:Endonuclease/exonuclease/phosphatase domain-containing protein n=1 Tax=Plectus sambesii TaxID=2011161 RepID=A0A914VFQ9_9BILA